MTIRNALEQANFDFNRHEALVFLHSQDGAKERLAHPFEDAIFDWEFSHDRPSIIAYDSHAIFIGNVESVARLPHFEYAEEIMDVSFDFPTF